MWRKGLLFLLACTLIVSVFTACEKVIATKEEENEDENLDDYTWDTTKVVQITLNTNSITVVPKVAAVDGSKVTITSAGTYNITGSLSDGQVIVNTKDDANVRLILSGVNIKCSNSAPVYILKAKKTIIILTEGTQNYLSDGTSYSTGDTEPNAALFSNSYLSFYGTGSLDVTANFKDGISSDDGLIIAGGTISVKSADDGIRGKDYLIIRDGNISVTSKGDALKSDNTEDAALGYIIINYGTFNISASNGDAVNAQTSLTIEDGIFTISTGGGAAGNSSGYTGLISKKALKSTVELKITKGTFKINSDDDAIHTNGSITISDGTFTIATLDDAVHADVAVTIKGGNINVSKCYEGVESASITVDNGNIIMASTDDTFNATKGNRTEMNDGSNIFINGGFIGLNASAGDGLDSNGNVTMTGGTVVIHGPKSQPEVGFDVNGTFNISGGFFIATGPNSGNMIETPSTSSSQYSVKVTIASTLPASTLFHIQDAGGSNLVTYKPIRAVYYVVVSSADLRNGSSYSVYTEGTSTGTETNGLYTGGSYSGGILKKTFTVSSKIATVSF
jgi:hypothetical protein